MEGLRPSFLAPYRRITSSGQFIPEIDGLRFIAILSVYIYHLAGDVLRHTPDSQVLALHGYWLFSVTQILNIGVPLFFVISGFILGLPFAAGHLRRQRPVPLKKYFLRRLTRLEPPYLLCLLLFFALKVLAGRGAAGLLLPHLGASVLYVHNLLYGAPSVINFVAWSMEIEIQFYLLAPVLALIFAVSKASVRRSLLVAGLLLATAVSKLVWGHAALELSLLGYAQYFLAGFLLVEIHLSGGLQRPAIWLWDLVSICGWPLLLALLVRGANVADWVAPWLILLLYVAAFRGLGMNRFVANAWIATIGGMCYSIYLLHNYVIAGTGLLTERFFADYPFEIRLLLQFALITPAVLAVGALYFRAVERPCMRPDWPQQLKAWLDCLRIRWFLTPAVASAARSAPDK
jgi:peptidoglycan/LPS O-acetylase OafA/YrhL